MDYPIRERSLHTLPFKKLISTFAVIMELRKDYQKPDLRVAEVRFEHALLQSSGTDRADDGYDPGIDLGDLD